MRSYYRGASSTRIFKYADVPAYAKMPTRTKADRKEIKQITNALAAANYRSRFAFINWLRGI